MKTLICRSLALGFMALPLLSFAQSTAGLTRAQNYDQLVRLGQAGYVPSAGDDAHYPDDLRAAEAHVAVQDAARALLHKSLVRELSPPTAQR